jgi:hypothetical protein
MSGSLLCALFSVPASAEDVGVKILVQPWTPQFDDDTAYAVVDDPTLLSGGLHDLWTAHSPALHQRLTTFLGQGDLLYDGVTLSEIAMDIPEPELEAHHISGGGTAPLLLESTLTFDNIHFEAKSTTPDIPGLGFGLGGWADPRCSVDFDLTVTMPLGVGLDANAPLFTDVTANQAGQRPIVRISDFHFSGENTICDVGVFLMETLDLDDKLTQLVTDPTSGPVEQLNEDLITFYREGLDQVNALVREVVPPGFVGVQAWAYSGQPITLAYSVGPALYPDDGLRNAHIVGYLTSPTGTVTCEDLPGMLGYARKTGPRPILNPSGILGDPPIQPLYTPISCTPQPDGTSIFYVEGLPDNFPTLLYAKIATGCDTHNAAEIQYVTFIDGLPGRLLPADLYGQYAVTADTWELQCGPVIFGLPRLQDLLSIIEESDPLLDPDRYSGLGWDQVLTSPQSVLIPANVSYESYWTLLDLF